MEKTIAIVELNNEVKDFMSMPDGIKKNLKYQRQFQGCSYSSGNVLIREDGTIHYSYSVYKVKRAKKFFLKKDSQYGFTVDPKGKMKVWFGGKLLTIPHLYNVLERLGKEWVKSEYLPFITPSIMGKIIAGKITNPHDLFMSILKMYRIKNASSSRLRQAVESNVISKFSLLQGIAVAKNLDHYLDFLINNKATLHNTLHSDLMQQALVLERKIDFNWSINRIAEEHKKWTAEIMDLETDSMDKEPLEWLNQFKRLSTGSYTLLDNEHAVYKEGKLMQHCVYTNYWRNVVDKQYVVFHVNNGSEYGLTLGLTYDKKNGLQFNQLHGRFNNAPSHEEMTYVKRWLEHINPLTKPIENEYFLM